jgi:hypothetical protein
VATLGCVWLVAQVGRLTTRTTWPSVLAAFAFGLSLNTISIGLEVRAYMLSVFFMLAAFYAYLLLVENGFGDRALKRRVTFVVCASLALMTHYSAAFLVAACLAGPVPSAVADRSFRERLAAGLRHRAVLNACTFGVPWLCLALLFIHLRSLSATGWPVNHVADYVFDPSREGASAFLFHGARGMLELLLPPLNFPNPTSTLAVIGPQLGPAGGGVTLVLLSIGLALLAYAVCVSPSTRSVTASATVTVAMVLLCIVALAAVAGKYPFGGPLRHQYLLLPFVLLVVFTALDQVLQRFRGWKARVIVCLAACAIAANAIAWMSHFSTTPGYMAQAEMNRFRTLFPNAPVVYVDQFNLITFFAHHHERDWTLVRRLEERGLDLWQVSDAYETFHVCRDRKPWLLDVSDPSLYYDIEACLDSTRATSVVIFRPQQHGVDIARPTESTTGLIPALSARAQLIGTRVAIEGEDVYAEFRRLDAATAGDLLRSGSERAVATAAGTGASSGGAAGIEVMQATYGSNCGAKWGNATADVANACNGMHNCDYQVDVRRLGDPAFGCAKQFVVEYRCSGGESKRVTVAAEAGLGGLASLACQ